MRRSLTITASLCWRPLLTDWQRWVYHHRILCTALFINLTGIMSIILKFKGMFKVKLFTYDVCYLNTLVVLCLCFKPKILFWFFHAFAEEMHERVRKEFWAYSSEDGSKLFTCDACYLNTLVVLCLCSIFWYFSGLCRRNAWKSQKRILGLFIRGSSRGARPPQDQISGTDFNRELLFLYIIIPAWT